MDTGIIIWKRSRGDAKEAEAVARRIFHGLTGQRVLVAMGKCSISRRIINDQNRTDDTKPLNMVEVIVFGTVVRALFDSSAVSNVMSVHLCSRLHLEPHQKNRRIMMVDETETGFVGEMTRVAITVGDLTCQMTFLVTSTAPFFLLIGRAAMKQMKALLHFDKDVANFR